MSRRHLVIPDTHAKPGEHNDRALWIAELIKDTKPDVVVHLGDSADMPSLSSYDRGTKGFHGRRYKDDIDAHLDFQDKLWSPVKKTKKRLPYRVFMHGNHEHRIHRAIESSSELDGTIGYHDLCLGEWYDEDHPYNGGTPAITNIDGVGYTHYAVSGVMGRPISGEHAAYTLITKHHVSVTVGHLHTLDTCVRHTLFGKPIRGLVAGCCIGYDTGWAGEAEKMWWNGVVLKNNVEDGCYDPQFISLEALRKEYG